MKEVMPGVHSSDPSALLEELKRYNEQLLSEHKRQLEEQYQQQLRQLLTQFRPPPRPLATKLALNQAEADERIGLVAKKAESLETAPKLSIVEGGQVQQVIRMSAETLREPYLVVSSTDEGAEVLEGSPPAPKKTGPPVHPSLRNHVFSKPVASSGQLKAVSRPKAEKKKKELVVSKHNQRETTLAEVTTDEAEGLVDKMGANTQYMLKKTAFLLDDSSKALAALQLKQQQKRVKAKRRHGGAGSGSGSGGNSSAGSTRPVLHSAGFTSMFDDSGADVYEDEDWGFPGQGQGRAAGTGAGIDEGEDEGEEIEDQAEVGRNASSQAPRRGSKVVFGPSSEVVFPPVDAQPAPLGSSSSRPSSGSSALKASGSSAHHQQHRVVEINSTERLPLLEGSTGGRSTWGGGGAAAGGGFEESKAGLGMPEGWSEQRVNDYEYAVDPHLVNNNIEWENEIARHVLSVYATSKIKDSTADSDRRHEAEYVMDFVDTEKKETLQSVKAYVLSDDGLGGGATLGAASPDGSGSWEQYIEDEELLQDEADEEAMALAASAPAPAPPPKHKDKYGLQKPRDLASQKIVQDFGDVVVAAQRQHYQGGDEAAAGGGHFDGDASMGSLAEHSLSSSVLDMEEARDSFPAPGGAGSSALARPGSRGNAHASTSVSMAATVLDGSAGAGGASPISRAGRSRGASRGSVQSAQSDASGPLLDSPPPRRRPQQQQQQTLHNQKATGGGSPSKSDTITAQEAGLVWDQEQSFRKTSKFRSVTLVKDPEGKVVPLRGSPRCFPIWFTSTGEVYSKWDRLPGGVKLQAHLTSLHERRCYQEYLGIIEKIIDDLWRERKLGRLHLDDFAKKRKSTRPRVQMAPGVLMDRARSASPTREKVNAGNPLAAIAFGGSGVIAPGALFPAGLDVSQSISGQSMASAGGHQPWTPAYAEEDAESMWTQKKNAEEARKAEADRVSDEELVDLWGQLILTANAMGVLCIEKKRAELGLEILNKAERWCNRDDILAKRQRNTLRAHVHDSLAYFFYKKGKSMSATSYTKLALEVHELDEDIEAVGVSLLHLSAIECQLSNFKGAHRTLYQFLAMVEDGRLSFEEASPKQLCVVAVAYHNLAVAQLKMLAPDLACKSSQNARKIARLCLSYSNRWMHVFQWTHDVALEDVRFQLTEKPGIPLSQKQLQVIKTLTMAMYNDEA